MRVYGTGRFREEGLWDVATDWSLTYEFANGVTLKYESGGFGVRFIGSDGWVESDFGRMTASSPEIDRVTINPDDEHLAREATTEHRHFLDCIKTRRPTIDSAESGHRTATLAHLGNIVLRLGRGIRWDPERERVLDDPGADQMRRRVLRAPWTLPS